MLESLVVYNFKNHVELPELKNTDVFTLKTCQRIVVVALKESPTNQILFKHEGRVFNGTEAYQFLLEVICGLKSKLVGENEIVGQFKTAYKEFCSGDVVNSSILLVLEKLLKDAKEIRSKYLIGICQKTYASVARKHMINKHHADEVLVLGSGSLAEDLINQFKKKAKVYISARNFEKVNKLANKHDLQIIPWKNIYLFQNFSHIANTIGAEETLLDQQFFETWAKKHSQRFFVDLSSGCCIQSSFSYAQGLMTLQDIFAEGAIHESRKKEQLKLAQLKMEEIVQKRYIHLKQKKQNRKQYGVRREQTAI
ncbi:MAG: hypothetical protein CME62_09755 [Halobacteriovoraceae bacterium]|nr:hypothetical protein [Halobacteriovoraceae bacterium]|tara:strand:+ start:10605 stop:11534 length:930 start_codon:yes stop_codon:yes gene_type:complete